MLLLMIGAVLLVLVTAAVARYSTSWQPLNDSDRLGALVFFVVVGLPVVFVGLSMIVRFVWTGI